jgi:integrase
MEGKERLPQDIRRAKKKLAARKMAIYTFDDLWDKYLKLRGDYPNLSSDRPHYEQRIKPYFGKKRPDQLKQNMILDFKVKVKEMKTIPGGPKTMLEAAIKHGNPEKERIAREAWKAQEKPLSKATQHHVLSLFRRLILFGVDNGLIKDPGVKFKLTNPENEVIEVLDDDQMEKLIDICWNDHHQHAGKIMLCVLFSGMRRSEVINLEWDRVVFDLDLVFLGKTKDGRLTNAIPMNSKLRDVLESIPQTTSPYVFPSPTTGKPYAKNFSKQLRRIKLAAGLPENFRPLHGLRHNWATRATISGGLKSTQGLLTHKDARTTSRYAHLEISHLAKVSERIAQGIAKKPAKVIPLRKKN